MISANVGSILSQAFSSQKIKGSHTSSRITYTSSNIHSHIDSVAILAQVSTLPSPYFTAQRSQRRHDNEGRNHRRHARDYGFAGADYGRHHGHHKRARGSLAAQSSLRGTRRCGAGIGIRRVTTTSSTGVCAFTPQALHFPLVKQGQGP